MSTEISAAIRTCTDDCPRTVKKLWLGVEKSPVSSSIGTSKCIPDCVVVSSHPLHYTKSQFLGNVFGHAHVYLRARPDTREFQSQCSVRPRAAANAEKPNGAVMAYFVDQYQSSVRRGV